MGAPKAPIPHRSERPGGARDARLFSWGPRHGPHPPKRSERPGAAVTLLCFLSFMGAPTRPPYPRRSVRSGGAVTLLYFIFCDETGAPAGNEPAGAAWRGLVGATGFEPATTGPPVRCATGLRYAPTRNGE